MATIITYSPLQSPTLRFIRGTGESVAHDCQDSTGQRHRQHFTLGSVKGIFYLDALCSHCGAHLVWTEDEEASSDQSD